MERQNMDWGWVDWFQPKHNKCQNLLTVGITTILPHTKQRLHRHYGNEQIIYVVKGSGIYYVNGSRIDFKDGQFYFFPIDCEHQTINDTDETIREIVVSLPLILKNNTKELNNNRTSTIETAVEIIKQEILNQKKFPIQILDSQNKIIFDSTSKAFSDSNSMIFFNAPIVVDNEILGSVRFLLEENDSIEKNGKNSDTLLSTITGIKSYLLQVSDEIKNIISELKLQNELSNQSDEIKRLGDDLKNLSVSLKKEKQMATNLKINHHFLFNILNHLSALSLSGERNELYECILDLSSMIRYSSKNDFTLASFYDELEYVKIYLRLQKRRYNDKMRVLFSIDDACFDQKVPFNILQPIVENAFSHGFMEYDEEKIIKISAVKDNEQLLITIANNGNPIDMATILVLNKNLDKRNGHGLNLINEKLKLYYGENFSFNIEEKSGFTIVKLIIPWRNYD